MKKYINSTLVTIAVAAFMTIGTSAYAQMASTMPAIYNQNNVQVNSTNSFLAAGYYYLAGGVQIYYYGNGTYYNASSQTYGGSVSDSTGMAGVSLGYVASAATAPGLPNTGAGGNAAVNWAILLASALVAVVGVSYLGKSRQTSKVKLA